jgi:hypothetical protein
VRRNLIIAAALSLPVGFAAGALSGVHTRTVIKHDVVRSGAVTECEHAVELANQGLGLAGQALGSARAAAAGTSPTATTPAGVGLQSILGQGAAQLEGFRAQFLEARAACVGSVQRSSSTTR